MVIRISRAVCLGGLLSLSGAVALAQPPSMPPAKLVPPATPVVFDASQKSGPQGESWGSIKQLPDWSGDWALDNASFARVRDTTDSLNAKIFTQPYIYVRTYDHQNAIVEALYQENNRDNNGEIDLIPPPLD